jgi:hypothetical protein
MTTYTCNYCSADFKRSQKLADHESICKIITNPFAASTATTDEDPDPIEEKLEAAYKSAPELYKLIKYLVKRQNKLESEIMELKKAAAVKVNILDWANKSLSPPITTDNATTINFFMSKISHVTSSQIKDLLDGNMKPNEWIKKTINQNLDNYIECVPVVTHRPILVVVNNSSATHVLCKVYCFGKWADAADNRPCWKETPDLRETIWDRLLKNILLLMTKWRDGQILDETAENLYQSILLKIIGSHNIEYEYFKLIKECLIHKLKYPTLTYQLAI